ncbi:MAG: DUF58 domain-containing protein [Spirochaetaceae bacterium]|nr:DUF58 domain-containing protein [Spirochaetaceae bacterium]
MSEPAESKQTSARQEPGGAAAPPRAAPGIDRYAAPKFLPLPRPLALLAALTAALSFAAGIKQGELVTSLLASVLSAALAWCYAGTLILALAHGKKAARLSFRLVPDAAAQGTEAVVAVNRGGADRFFRLPGILIRGEMTLRTVDNRRFEAVFDPDRLEKGFSPVTVPRRGAYAGREDRFIVMDVLGFFRAALDLASEGGSRLLSMPESRETPLFPVPGGGGERLRTGENRNRSGNFIDHRPYVPGDDPRRINWKLYGHSGDLFIREDEREPPSRARLLVLIDTQYDVRLYTPEGGSAGVDLLASHALAFITACHKQCMNMEMGYSGGESIPCTDPAGAARALALPAALPLRAGPRLMDLWGGGGPEIDARLPETAADRRAVVFALPREKTDGSALDRWLGKRAADAVIEVVFLYGEDRLALPAEVSAARYAGIKGIRAGSARV